MKFNWVDYESKYALVVEGWLDSEAKKYTGCDGGWNYYFEYWKNDESTQIGDSFGGKVVFEDITPFAVISVGKDGNIFIISEYIVAPEKRGKGYGTAILCELLENSREIFGKEINTAEAVIYHSNIASRKAFEKSGFKFDREHPDGDTWYYKYIKAILCFCGHDCSRCVTYLATVRNDNELRKQAQIFYKDEFGYDIPLDEIHCLGGRSNDIFKLCRYCPWMKCCHERGICACSECPEYPCKPLAEYADKYVNKCNQI